MSVKDLENETELYQQIQGKLTSNENLQLLLQSFMDEKNVIYCKENGMGEGLEEAFAVCEDSAIRKNVVRSLTVMVSQANYVLKNAEQLARAYLEKDDAALKKLLLENVSRVSAESPVLELLAEKVISEGQTIQGKRKDEIKGDYDILLRLLGQMNGWGSEKVALWLKVSVKKHESVAPIFQKQDIMGSMLERFNVDELKEVLKDIGPRRIQLAGSIDKSRNLCVKHFNKMRKDFELNKKKAEVHKGVQRGVAGPADSPFSTNFFSMGAPQGKQQQSSDAKKQTNPYDCALPKLGEFVYGFFTTFNAALPEVMGATDDYFDTQDCETKWDSRQASLQVQITNATGYCGMMLYFFQHALQEGKLGVRICRGEGEGLYVYEVANQLKHVWEEMNMLPAEKPTLDDLKSEPNLLPDPSPDTVPATQQLSRMATERLSSELAKHDLGDIELTEQMCTDNISGFNDAIKQMSQEVGPDDERNDGYLRRVCRENAIMLSRSLAIEENKKVLSGCGEELAKSLVAVWKQYMDDYTITLKATDVLKELKQSEVIGQDCLAQMKELAKTAQSHWSPDSAKPSGFPSEKIMKNIEALSM